MFFKQLFTFAAFLLDDVVGVTTKKTFSTLLKQITLFSIDFFQKLKSKDYENQSIFYIISNWLIILNKNKICQFFSLKIKNLHISTHI